MSLPIGQHIAYLRRSGRAQHPRLLGPRSACRHRSGSALLHTGLTLSDGTRTAYTSRSGSAVRINTARATARAVCHTRLPLGPRIACCFWSRSARYYGGDMQSAARAAEGTCTERRRETRGFDMAAGWAGGGGAGPSLPQPRALGALSTARSFRSYAATLETGSTVRDMAQLAGDDQDGGAVLCVSSM